MSLRERMGRLGIGILVALLLVVGCFAVVVQLIPTWGATANEVARVYPGDDLVRQPMVSWTHGITINAPVQEVWGWIAQIGERRGGFYSYTFIENQMGNGDVYHNADRIVPEWQNPKPGDAIIAGTPPMRIQQIEPGKNMVAYLAGDFQWMWGWYLEPIDAQHTRLLVRMKIQVQGLDNPIVGNIMNFGGFMMEQHMLQGIQQRAQGDIPPAYTEPLEIALWLITLVAGTVAGAFFVLYQKWIVPLAVAVLAVLVLFLITFWQPPVWTRVALDVILWASLAWFAVEQHNTQTRLATSRQGRESLTLKPMH